MNTPDIVLDFDRPNRCGIEEAILCEFKSVAQLETILQIAKTHQKRLLLTRLAADKYTQLSPTWQAEVNYDEVCCCGVYGDISTDTQSPTRIAIVSAGSSDAKVCGEIVKTITYHGIVCDLFQDVGVSGLWRLQQHLPKLKTYDVIIAVAGMEAALPTVLAGLIDAPIIAVPTSIGYGISAGGHVALNACLSSCGAGIMTMNIDNGYGAGVAAIKIYHKLQKYAVQSLS